VAARGALRRQDRCNERVPRRGRLAPRPAQGRSIGRAAHALRRRRRRPPLARPKNGGGGGFAARLELARPAAEQLVYATFLGGVQLDRITALAVDAAGGITIASTTSSTDHPVTPDAFDATFNGGSDAVVAVLDPARQGLRQLACATFLGGSGDDRATAVLLAGSGAVTVGALADSAAVLAAEASGAVTAAGQARSTNYPVTAGAWHETYAGGLADAVVTRLDLLPAGTRRQATRAPAAAVRSRST
jgi:hypothetical protein